MTGARGIRLYALAATGAIAIAAAILHLVYRAPVQRRAVLVSAAVALAVQLPAFVVARLLAAGGNGIAGWGLGAIACFATLILYGYVSPGLGLPSDVAMISLAAFLFLTEVIEPPFLDK